MRHEVPFDRLPESSSNDWCLTSAEADQRRIVFGPNDIIEEAPNRWLELSLDVAKDPMIWFLFGCSALFAVLHNYNQSLILLLATIPLLCMDAFLHWRTTSATRILKSHLATSSIVIRNGMELEIPVTEIVPGDLVKVKLGQTIPVDGLIIQGNDLQIDESALTGEALPVAKKTLSSVSLQSQNIQDYNWVFAGTVLLTGTLLIRACYTGQETLYGEIITSTVITQHQRTPLQNSIAHLTFSLILFAIMLCIILAVARYLQGFGAIDALLSASILAVAALPDEFPVVFTFFLALGVYRLAHRKALVRRAVSIENIGRITAICSDKTGTITEGKLQFLESIPASNTNFEMLVNFAALASRFQSGDPLDIAIHAEAVKQQIKLQAVSTTYPFTEERLRETAVINDGERSILFACKGSPEKILSISNLRNEERQAWLKRVSDAAANGYKVIGVAYQKIENSSERTEPENGYVFAGLLLFTDPIRKEVKGAIARCLNSGIHVLIITGDHPETARMIAKEIGLGSGSPRVILAEAAHNLASATKANFYRTVDVIARAIPSQKLSIVTSLQAHGDIVAVTGDGVNDVPALKAADIGIAMGLHGTRSAREAAKIVLLDDNFNSIVNAISEGKQLFKNLQLSYKYLLMIHMPFIFSAAIIPLLGYPLLYLPIHIVLIELFIHPTSMLVFQDLPEGEVIEKVHTNTKVYFFSRKDWLSILGIGIITTVLIIFSYMFIYRETNSIEHARAFSLGALGIFSAAITAGLSNMRTMVARIIIIMTLIMTIVCIQFIPMSRFFAVIPLSLFEWIMLMMIGAGIAVLTRLTKNK